MKTLGRTLLAVGVTRCACLGLIALVLLPGSCVSVAAPVEAHLGEKAVEVTVAGVLFTEYRFSPELKKPYLWPLAGPLTGKSVTSETSDLYPHHNSMWFGCDHLNGRDYWHHQNPDGAIRSRGPFIVTAEGEEVVWIDVCDWVPLNGRKAEGPVMRDFRRIAVRAPDVRTRIVDFTIALLPLTTVTITKTNHSLFALRMAPSLSVASGGTMVDSDGRQDEKGTFGKTSPWLDCYGERDGKTEGAAILQHPANRWYPSPWSTRDYGFFSPTPMQWLPRPLVLGRWEPTVLSYRVIVHLGSTEEASIEAQWTAFSSEAVPGLSQLNAMLVDELLEPLPSVATYTFGGSRTELAAIERAVAMASVMEKQTRKAVSQRLGWELGSPVCTRDASRFLCSQLGLIAGAAGIPALLKCIAGADEAVAETAIQALGSIRVPEAAAALAGLTESLAGRLRLSCITALGHQGSGADAVLVELLDSDDAATREAVAMALARRRSTSAVNALLAAYRSGPEDQRGVVERALLSSLEKRVHGLAENVAATACRELVSGMSDSTSQIALVDLACRWLPTEEQRRVLLGFQTGADAVLRGRALAVCATVPDRTVPDAAATRFSEFGDAEQVVLRDLKVKSMRAYAVHRGGLRPGAKWATDREYVVKKLPDILHGASYIETAMDDKSASSAPDFLTFRVEEPVLVYVGFDSRCKQLPAWLEAWKKTDERIEMSSDSCYLVLYQKAFPVGPVAVGGCKAPGVGAIYTVAVVPGG